MNCHENKESYYVVLGLDPGMREYDINIEGFR